MIYKWIEWLREKKEKNLYCTVQGQVIYQFFFSLDDIKVHIVDFNQGLDDVV